MCVPPPSPVPGAEVERAVADAMREAVRRKISGKEMTPFLLASLAQATAGRTLSANLDLLENNARIAGEIAAALARPG